MENPFSSSSATNQEAQWISLSDLMTGLMMVFMLIAIAFMVKVDADSNKTKKIVTVYDKTKQELYQQLCTEFDKDLSVWGAEIEKQELTIRFKEPDVLFATGENQLNAKFQAILADFFPRYVKIITSSKFKDSIQEIRIEGHTSSIWNGANNPTDAYFKNMELSQSRTRSTLQFVLGLQKIQKNLPWLKKHVTANGLSSSKPILTKSGRENFQRSQRVEFRIRTDAEAQINSILDSSK